MDGQTQFRVHFHDENGEPKTVICRGELERDGDRIWIGDCLFREKEIIWLYPVNNEVQP